MSSCFKYKVEPEVCLCSEENGSYYDKTEDFDEDGYTDQGFCGTSNVNLSVQKFVLHPIVKSESCNCIVEGKVKYVIGDETSYIVNYGDGECDDWATKTVYSNDKGKSKWGKKSNKKDKSCKFQMKCEADD